MKRRNFYLLIILGFLLTGCYQSGSEEPTKSDPSQESLIVPTIPMDFAGIVFFRTENRSENNRIILLDSELNTMDAYSNSYSNLFLSSLDCNLLEVWNFSGKIEINSLGSGGKLVDSKTINYIQESGYEYYQTTISPMQNWISFKQISNDYERSFESATTQDIKLVKIDNNVTDQEPITITERGGARPSEATWSPDGNFIAFTDFDNNNLMQVFIYNPNSPTRNQITHFSQKHILSKLRWSPDSTMIALSIYDTETGEYGELPTTGYMELLYLSDLTSRIILPEKLDQTKFHFWWGEENQLLILTGSLTSSGVNIIWYDTIKNNVERTLDSDFFNIGYPIYYAFPLTKDLKKIGVVGYGKIFTYDYETNSYISSSNEDLTEIFFLGDYKLIETSSGIFYFPACQ